MCNVAIVSDSSFTQMKQSIHLVNPWNQWLPLCTSWKIYSISGPWIYIPQTFWYNGIVLGPVRVGIWLCRSVDGFPMTRACAFVNVLTWSSSLKSSLTYSVGRNASHWPFMRKVACRLWSWGCDVAGSAASSGRHVSKLRVSVIFNSSVIYTFLWNKHL